VAGRVTQPLAPQIHATPGSPASVRVGVVDSITGGVTVSVQGTVMQGVGLLGSYAPRPGDSVILLGQSSEAGSDPASWVALGASSQQPQSQLLMTKVQRTTLQSIPNNAFTAISWNGVLFDNMGGFPTGSTTSVLAPFDGWYELTGRPTFIANVTGVRQGVWFHNGGSTESFVNMSATPSLGARMAMLTHFVNATAGDLFQMQVFQNSGIALDTESGSGVLPQMTVRYLGVAS
jgi:hypothetical protein